MPVYHQTHPTKSSTLPKEILEAEAIQANRFNLLHEVCARCSQPARCAPCRPVLLKGSTNNRQHSIKIFLLWSAKGQCCRKGDKHPARMTCPPLGGRGRNGNHWPELQAVQSLMTGCSANRDTVRQSQPQELCQHGMLRGEDSHFSRTPYFLNDLRQPPHCCSTLTSQMPSKGCSLMVWAALPSLTCLFPHLSLDPPPYIMVFCTGLGTAALPSTKRWGSQHTWASPGGGRGRRSPPTRRAANLSWQQTQFGQT